MNDEAIQAAKRVMENHLTALNARDLDALAKTLHFPHFRLANQKMKVWETPDSYLDDFRHRAGEDWGYSEWGKLEPLQGSDDKVHLDVVVRRFTPSGSLIVEFTSLWVIARIDGVWAAKVRSSFAPDPK